MLTGFTDAESDPLSVTGLNVSNGTVTDNHDGTYTITPGANVNGAQTLTYTVSDGNGGNTAASVGLTLDPVNDAPALTGTPAVLAHGTEDTAYTVSAAQLLTGFTDVENDPLSVTGLTVSNGTVTDNHNGTFTIAPDANVNGPQTLSYTVSDGHGGSTAASLGFALDPVNDAPALTGAQAILAHGTEDVAYTVTAAQLLTGFTDAENDTLSVTGLTVSNGTVADNHDGTYTITPGANVNGAQTLSYTVSDGHGGNTATSLGFTLDPVDDGKISTSTATYTFYGDSISDYTTFSTFNLSLYRDLAGRMRLAENSSLLASGDISGGREGWDAAIAGTTVTDITQRFVKLVPHDESDVVFVLMGANNYSPAGSGTPQQWIDAANQIIKAAADAGKILVFIPPIGHHNDPVPGRDALKAYLPTVASETVIVPDVSSFDWRVDTNDGVHPNAIGAQLIADQVAAALAAKLPAAYDLSAVKNTDINLATNGELAGTAGTLFKQAQGQTAGEVATGWALHRIGATGTAIAHKGVDANGNPTQILSYKGQGEARLTETININAHAGEQYELAVKIKVSDPNHQFLGFRAFDSLSNDGVLFAGTEGSVLASGGTGDYETILRSGKLTLTADQHTATINLSAVFGNNSGATVTIEDVIVRLVDGTPAAVVAPQIGTDTGDLLYGANSVGTLLQGLGGNDTLFGGHGADTLDGGSGADMMFGGAGDDTYYVDSAKDKVFETTTSLVGDNVDLGGNDTVISTVSYSIAATNPGRQFIENLTLAGTAATAVGNDLNNVLTGNAGNNAMLGGGGDDTLIGGAGSDRLDGGAGNDLVIGGAGSDTLIGGPGTDTFRFDVLETSANRDIVNDFVHGVDRIELSISAFGALGGLKAGPLDPAQLAIGAAATNANQHLVFNPGNGTLYYDADGAGGQAAVAIAKFINFPVIDASDIFLI